MQGVLDIKSPNFLFGNNVHNTIQIVLLLGVAWKVGLFKKA